jgi:hypothetical protein
MNAGEKRGKIKELMDKGKEECGKGRRYMIDFKEPILLLRNKIELNFILVRFQVLTTAKVNMAAF